MFYRATILRGNCIYVIIFMLSTDLALTGRKEVQSVNIPVIKKILAGAAAAVLLCTFSACGQGKDEEQQLPIEKEEDGTAYPIAVAEYGTVIRKGRVTCFYRATEYEKFAFASADKQVEKVEVKKGDIVEAGDLLAALDVEELDGEVEELEYEIRHLNLELAHVQELKAFDVTSAENLYSYTHMTQKDKTDLEEKKAEIEERYHDTIEDLEDSLALTQKRLDTYRIELEEGQLIAGIAGEVTFIKEGLLNSYSIEDETVITISNLDSCFFIATDVAYAGAFKEGEPVYVVYTEKNEEKQVEVLPVDMDTWQDQMVFKPVESELLENGLSGSIYLELERKENVLCVPTEAVHEAEDGTFVYITKDGLLSMRYVKAGIRGDEMTEIMEGLSEGESVVLR